MSIVTSIKNVQLQQQAVTATISDFLIAKAVQSPVNTNKTDVAFGCLIKNIYISLDFCGLAASGVLATIDAYLIKNPGDNLTLPTANSVGGSNEKKFVFKQWRAMTMRNQDGNPPYHWEGWIKVPKRYQRMGIDDTFRLGISSTAGTTGHGSVMAIYKWFR